MPRPRRTRAATGKSAGKSIETLRHTGETRPNIPTAEYQTLLRKEEAAPIQVAYQRRNRDLDPQLVWRGKDAQDQADLVVNAPPLYIQEKVQPKALIDDLRRQSKQSRESGEHQGEYQTDLFADFNGLPEGADRTAFYRHDGHWQNRMILGDSLQVMASLTQREGLAGKVQCIYIDPPYGIRFNSNFQWSTTSRDVRDGNAAHITREPEQVKAFRDTWRDGIHSYLTYLRDRLTVARDLLTDSGSVFVQIGDENVHRVRALLDEVFGEENFVSLITCRTSSGTTQQNSVKRISDYIIWYSRNVDQVKFRRLLEEKHVDTSTYNQLELDGGIRRPMTTSERKDPSNCPTYSRPYRKLPVHSMASGDHEPRTIFKSVWRIPPTSHWRYAPDGFMRLYRASRIQPDRTALVAIYYHDDYPAFEISNSWMDTGPEIEKSYVVQTSTSPIERCLLMTTDPGDLALDPTCGSGTTAYVAEQWGRRWITIDTSRVALALARARIMGARYPYYLLADSREGQLKEAELSRRAPSELPTYGNIRPGFVYARVPHITLRAIANNAEIDVIWETAQAELEPLRQELNRALGQAWEEWELPREAGEGWPEEAVALHARWWERRIARQREIDASIAARADYEYLYDQPCADRSKVRVAGPFTVESISPHRVLGVDENGDVIDGIAESGTGYGAGYDFGQVILDHLKRSGVQQAHKEDRITFTSLTPWPGRLVCAEGRYFEGGKEGIEPDDDADDAAVASGPEQRAAIFVGPEFGTVSRPDLVEAAREAAECGFDVLIACAFNYDAHSTEFESLGRIPVLKARMNADLHMAGELKNTGAGNLFVIFGEPDISVASGQWLVASGGRMVANYDLVKELSGLGSLEEINRVGRDGLSDLCRVSPGREVRHYQPGETGGGVGSGEHRGGGGTARDGGVYSISGSSERLPGGDGDFPDSGATAENDEAGAGRTASGAGVGSWTDAQRAQTLAAGQNIAKADFPLTLTTGHWTQITVNGVDVFHPNTGEVRSDGPEGIACWFIDTDYNQESFFVRQAYFLGASDPYKSLKTTLKAEIDADAWATLHRATSRPFPKPESGRIAVKVINHLGDEVMKVFRVG